MAEHDFSYLYAQYPAVISSMPEKFTSHEFIIELARHNQAKYIEALYHYRNHLHRDHPAPFLMVHSVLALHLLQYPAMINQIRKDIPSKDIWGHDNTCSEWQKV